MLQVLCSRTELDGYGERVAVGDRVSRLARRNETDHYGTALDAVEWRFAQDAEPAGDGTARITGTVTAVSAVYVELTQLGSCTWTAAHGTAHLEALRTTADARLPELSRRGPAPLDDTRFPGAHLTSGRSSVEEGDEDLSGWLIELDDERVEPV